MACKDCDEHKECMRKLLDNCIAVKRDGDKILSLTNRTDKLERELWNGNKPIIERIKSLEEKEMNVETLITNFKKESLDKMDEIKEDGGKNIRGLFKIFILTITAASVIVGGMFSILWYDIHVTKASPVSEQSLSPDLKEQFKFIPPEGSNYERKQGKRS